MDSSCLSSKGGTLPKSRGIRRTRVKVTKIERMEWTIAYKVAAGCADCGYNGHSAALDFDHRPGTKKVRDIKSGQQLGWTALQEEIAKCDVVCANCHRIRTYNRGREEKDARSIAPEGVYAMATG